MAHFIQGKEVTKKDVGVFVTYVPRHANKDVNHPDCELGIISSFNESCLFIRYKSTSGQNTPPELLVWDAK